MHKGTWLKAVGALALSGGAAMAQEAMYTNAATMPGPGNTLIRVQPHIFRYGAGPIDGSERTTVYSVMNTVQLGLVKDFSLSIDAPVEMEQRQRPGGTVDTDTTVPEVDFMFKWRFFREDSGGVNTKRAALLFGPKIDLADGIGVDPHIGAVWTEVRGRHGYNLELHYTLTTGDDEDRVQNLGGEGVADALAYNAAYVFRVEPAQYTSASTGAWYATAELNGMYETNGDNEIHFVPGLMYEGRRFGFEVMVKIPVYADVDQRPELDWAIGAGFRYLF